jgi:very-short-patch-repair endonuclease
LIHLFLVTLKKIKRDQYLEGLEFSILRFGNRLAFQEPEFVINKIRKTFNRKNQEFE